MKLISINNNCNPKPMLPAFQASVPKPKRLLTELTTDSFTQIISNPEKNKTFHDTIADVIGKISDKSMSKAATLLVAVGATLANLMNSNNEETLPETKISQSNDGDVIEVATKENPILKTEEITNTKKVEQQPQETKSKKVKEEVKTEEKAPAPVKFCRHSGEPNKIEKELEATINQAISKLNPDIEQKNKLISLYNRFAGKNYKGSSFDNKNNIIENQEIAKNLIGFIGDISKTEDINEIVDLASEYTVDKKDLPVEKKIVNH